MFIHRAAVGRTITPMVKPGFLRYINLLTSQEYHLLNFCSNEIKCYLMTERVNASWKRPKLLLWRQFIQLSGYDPEFSISSSVTRALLHIGYLLSVNTDTPTKKIKNVLAWFTQNGLFRTNKYRFRLD